MEIEKKIISDKTVKITLGSKINEETNLIDGEIELDIENQSELAETINNILDEENLYIILDMKNISYIDSSGLWAIFEGHKKTSQKSGKLLILNPTKDVLRVLDITKISSKISIFDNETQAINFLTNPQ